MRMLVALLALLALASGAYGQQLSLSTSRVVPGLTPCVGCSNLDVLQSDGTFVTNGATTGTATVVRSTSPTLNTSFILGGTGATTFSYITSGIGTTQELTISNTQTTRNVLALQNNSNTGESAIVFRDTSSNEHGAVGYSNPGNPSPFGSAFFVESSDLAGTNPPVPMKFVQTGVLNAINSSYVRQQFDNAGNTFFYQQDGTTQALKIKFNGLIGVGAIDPAALLHVFSNPSAEVARFETSVASGFAYISVKSSTGQTLVGNNATGGWVGPSTNQFLSLKSNDTEIVRVTTTAMIQEVGQTVLKGYTVGALPTGIQGGTAFVTDAVACTFLTTVTGGGAAVCPVFFDGTSWKGG